jgi:alkylation response protein AidB-like acyl-CoA dehydrogenase
MEDFLDIKVDEQHEELRKWARDFAQREILPVAERIDRYDEYPRELARKMGEYGLLGLNMPQEYGGLNLDMLSSVIVGEEIAKVSLSAGFILGVQNGLIGNLIAKFGSKEQKEKYLPRLVRGEIIGSYGLTEPGAGSDAASISTSAVRDGDEYVINGSKIWITQGAVCDILGRTEA